MLFVVALLLLLALKVADVNAFSAANPPPPTTTTSSRSAQWFAAHFEKANKKNGNNDAVGAAAAVTLTYLEINGWLLSTSGVTILIDPLLEGSLDFGVPDLYQGKKRVLPASGMTKYLPPIDCILLTQGLPDHTDTRTLRKIRENDPTVPVVAPPSAGGALKEAGFIYVDDNNKKDDVSSSKQICILNHRQEVVVKSRTDDHRQVRIRATEGALVGPPWQKRENGYILQGMTGPKKDPSIYIEPHVEFNSNELKRLGPVDIVISPITGQGLPAFELVHGPEDTIRLLEALQPKYLVPMQNGDVDSNGLVSKLVTEVGSVSEFKQRLSESKINTQLVNVKPGEDIHLTE